MHPPFVSTLLLLRRRRCSALPRSLHLLVSCADRASTLLIVSKHKANYVSDKLGKRSRPFELCPCGGEVKSTGRNIRYNRVELLEDFVTLPAAQQRPQRAAALLAYVGDNLDLFLLPPFGSNIASFDFVSSFRD